MQKNKDLVCVVVVVHHAFETEVNLKKKKNKSVNNV